MRLAASRCFYLLCKLSLRLNSGQAERMTIKGGNGDIQRLETPHLYFFIIVTFNRCQFYSMKALLLLFSLLILSTCYGQNADSLEKISAGKAAAAKKLGGAAPLDNLN